MSIVKNPGEGVCYTAKGHWKPTIHGVICGHCGSEFTAHKVNAQFCSRSCAAKATARRVHHTERTCPGCSKVWAAPPSNPSRYCSKTCLYTSGKWKKAKRKTCGGCGAAFTASWCSDKNQFRKYCSKACANEGLADRVEKDCANCGKAFGVNRSRADEETCSRKCANEYFLRDRHHAWKGGKVLQGERQFRRVDREGYAANYEGEHRLVAAREIGRPIQRGEVVLCLDGDNDNFAPSNLFLCPDYSEFGLIRSGAVEWPQSSNLPQMRENNYVRPDVVLTVYEWENGTRTEGGTSKRITRHPQADEIIKRRKAGASLDVLAGEFGCSRSSMYYTLRKRL